MKKLTKTMLGMSFVEVSFLLAIVAGIALGGLYFYGYIGNKGTADQVLDKIRAVNNAVSTLQSSGNSLNSLNTDSVSSLLAPGMMTMPWGEKMIVAGTTEDSYTINIPQMPAAICKRVMDTLSKSPRYDLSSTECPDDKNATVSFSYTYSVAQEQDTE